MLKRVDIKKGVKKPILPVNRIFFSTHWRVGEFYYYVVYYNADFV